MENNTYISVLTTNTYIAFFCEWFWVPIVLLFHFYLFLQVKIFSYPIAMSSKYSLFSIANVNAKNHA